jgi:hypothetical protein
MKQLRAELKSDAETFSKRFLNKMVPLQHEQEELFERGKTLFSGIDFAYRDRDFNKDNLMKDVRETVKSCTGRILRRSNVLTYKTKKHK